MPQPCKICRHAQRQAIDAALLEGCPPLRSIGQQYGVSKDSLFRHYQRHLPGDPEAAEEAPGVADDQPQPRQTAEDSTVKNSEGWTDEHEAVYQAFVARWRLRAAIERAEMVGWYEPPEIAERRVDALLRVAVNRGDLMAIGKYYCATTQAIGRIYAEKC